MKQILINIKNWICDFYMKCFNKKKEKMEEDDKKELSDIQIISCKVRSIKVK